jgi:2-polyprenyl-3-methyl-5-hydroxy-6-metoxy-1,4-benzoquinol methylase
MVSGGLEHPIGEAPPGVRAVGSYHDLVRRDVFPALPQNVGRVLDVGGGVGATSGALKEARRASYVVVADQVADQVLGEVDRAYGGNLEDEAFVLKVLSEAGPFDTILALDVLEHLRDPWKVVRILHGGLVPNGVIVASIPNVNYHGLVLPLVLRGRYDLTDAGILDRTHIRWFAKHGAIELMSSSGLEIEVVMPNITRRKHALLNTISFGALTRFLALQYIIRARRVD